jgi:hypothetical protein
MTHLFTICHVKYLSKMLKLSHYCHASTEGDVWYSSYTFLTSAVDGGEQLASCPSCYFYPQERTPDTHWVRGWMGLRTGLDTEVR